MNEIARRRTFAIISHPDAGKTTLTEKLLLYGGAVHLAGTVTARKSQRATASDWMELEKKRGISISSTVLQFDYDGYRVNLLDTPGHRDFSEDTYRVLTAVDAVVMVIDAAKGIESQTRKLFEVCRQRRVPIFTFINKLDRPSKEPLELIDELEKVLNLRAFPMNWPLGTGFDFRGVYDRIRRHVHLFERVPGGAYRAPEAAHDPADPVIAQHLDPLSYSNFVEETAMLDHAGASSDRDAILRGETTPVFFGSASNNFGVQLLLDGFLAHSPGPVARVSSQGSISPDHPAFSGFIFKIQGNMDPRHRDRVAFLRVCSGQFVRDMAAFHSGSDKKIKLANSFKLFGRDREIVEEARAGDIVGLVGHSAFKIGDTLSETPGLIYDEIPRFPPESFSFIHNPNPANYKPFRKGLEQLLLEGIVQSFSVKDAPPLLAAVGPLQFEVVQFRLESEYGVSSRFEPAPWKLARWVDGTLPSNARIPFGSQLAADGAGGPAILFRDEWSLNYFTENHPSVSLRDQARPSPLLPQTN
ncbi:MAG: peptide chain release factor 3 [Elusimicrobia bacterium]|nr:peptide chain release factor 3 [Elusimicrobiota bacterium]